MNPLHLRVFIETARRGSIAAAADALRYTPSAISRHISALEQSAGSPLLVRESRGIRLTAAGERLLPHAQQILERIDLAHAELSLLRIGAHETIRLAASRAVVMRFLADALETFRASDPEVGILFELADDHPALELVRTGAVDVVIATDIGAVSDPDVDVVTLLKDPLLCALPAGHRLASARTIDLGDIASEMWTVALPRRSATQRLHDAAERRGLVLGHEYVVDDYHAMLGLVAAGLANACVPAISLPTLDARVVVRPFDAPMTRRVAAVIDRSATTRAPVARLLDALRSAAAQHVARVAEVTGQRL
jgi:DNA-binding transcriptional LysR family regulator